MKSVLKSLRQKVLTPSVLRLIRKTVAPKMAVYNHLPFRGRFTVDVDARSKFDMIAHGDALENYLFWSGYGKDWEAASLKRWADLARSSTAILDVGANTGVFALSAQAVNPSAKILAIEATPRTAERLKQNVAANGFPITVEAVAASDQDGEATFYDFPGDHQYSASLDPGMGGTIKSIVPVKRIDAILAEHGWTKVDLMKMDVERHEPSALRGMRECLERDRPTILIEILDDDCRRGVEEVLDGLDYKWELLAEAEGRNYLLTSGS